MRDRFEIAAVHPLTVFKIVDGGVGDANLDTVAFKNERFRVSDLNSSRRLARKFRNRSAHVLDTVA